MDEAHPIPLYQYTEENPRITKTLDQSFYVPGSQFEVQLCVYNINTNCYIEGIYDNIEDTKGYTDNYTLYNETFPFLEFFMEKKEAMYSFPSSQYVVPSLNATAPLEHDDDDAKTPEQVFFENQCFMFLLSLFHEKTNFHSPIMDIGKHYKGFIKDVNQPILYVIFDITGLPIIQNIKSQYVKANIDEIVYKRRILNTPVSDTSLRLFVFNDELINVYSNAYEKYTFPFQLYMCKKVEGGIENVKKGGLIHTTYEHPVIGTAYFFSAEPVNDADPETLQRFTCFIVKCLSLNLCTFSHVRKTPPYGAGMSERGDCALKMRNGVNTDITTPLNTDRLLSASTIEFTENGNQMWAIKNLLHFTILDVINDT